MTYTYFVTYIFFNANGDPLPGYANAEYKNSQPIVSMVDVMAMQNQLLLSNHGVEIRAVVITNFILLSTEGGLDS